MRLYLYALVACFGIVGIVSGLKPEWFKEVLFGFLGPASVGFFTIRLFSKFDKMSHDIVRKWMMISFGLKMLIYPIYFIIIIKVYSFYPYPFVFSFAGFFIGLHILEAIVLQTKSKIK